MNMSENRNERLAFDYGEMLKLQNRPYLSWIVTKGDIPYAEEYLLTVRLRTYALSAKENRYIVSAMRGCTVRVTLWDSYPLIAPNIRMLNIPPVFHPNWYAKGTYCPSQPWRPDTSLKEYVGRLIATLTWEPSLIESEAPANYKALDWYRKNRDNSAWFPSDRTELTENTPEEIAMLKDATESADELIDSWGIG